MTPAPLRRSAPLLAGLFALCGACSSSPLTPNADAAAPGADPPGPPPSADTCRPQSGTRLRARFFHHEAGPDVFIGWLDKKLGVPCAFKRAGDGLLRCLPLADALPRTYSDPGCTRRATEVDCTDARYVLRHEPNASCEAEQIHVHPLGDSLPAGSIRYVQRNGQCVEVGVSSALRAVGEALPPTDFVEATEQPGLAGRITVPVLAGADGSRQPCGILGGQLFDRERGELCEITAAPEEKHRCLPVDFTWPITGSYANDLCSRQLYASDCRQPTYVRPKGGLLRGERCPLKAVHSVATARAVSGPGFALDAAGAMLKCLPRAETSNVTYWEAGDAIPDTVLAEASPIVEPALRRLGAHYWELPGGHRQFRGVFEDADRARTCTPRLASDGKIRCMPGVAPVSDVKIVYRDPACTVAARIALIENCSTVTEILTNEGPPCARVYRSFSVGPGAGGALYEKQDAGCMPFNGPNIFHQYVSVGHEIPAVELALVEERVE